MYLFVTSFVWCLLHPVFYHSSCLFSVVLWLLSLASFLLLRSQGSLGVKICVQSERQPEYLDSRIEAFLHSLEEVSQPLLLQLLLKFCS